MADFGLAESLSTAGDGTRLRPAGTALYMAPEAIARREVDARSDLYSLGCTLFRIATGKRPFPGDPAMVIARKRSPSLRPLDPRLRRPTLSSSFASILMRLTEPEPVARYTGASEAARALEPAVAPIRLAHVARRVKSVAPRRSPGTRLALILLTLGTMAALIVLAARWAGGVG